jgi:hypothetical protein
VSYSGIEVSVVLRTQRNEGEEESRLCRELNPYRAVFRHEEVAQFCGLGREVEITAQ